MGFYKNLSEIKKFVLWGIVCAVLGIVFWILGLNVSVLAAFALAAIVIGAVSVFLFVIALALFIAKKREKKRPSPCGIFAILDAIAIIGVSIYSINDIMTDTGILAGLLGTILLVVIVPCLLGLLLIDGIVALVIAQTKNYEKKEKARRNKKR